MPTENGYVPTPPIVSDYVTSVAFGAERPSDVDDGGRILLPGLGTGNLYDAVKRYCTPGEGWPANRTWEFDLPECVGVENDPQRIQEFHDEHGYDEPIQILERDFLLDPPEGPFDWILANPPYLRYKAIDGDKRDAYRRKFRMAKGQFDLAMVFYEQAMRLLKDDGWLTFILPLAALLTNTYEPFRWGIRSRFVEPIRYLPPETFDEKVETFVVSVQKRDSPGNHLWFDHLYNHAAETILEGLGVDDVDVAVDEYFDEYRLTEELICRRDHRERDKRAEVGAQRGLEEWGVSG